jgi:hypothetical protein
LEPRDLVEFEAFDIDDRGRSSENGMMRKTARSPEPKAAEEIKFNGKENDQKSDVKPNYNKSVTFRKMQMQRNRNKQISSKVSVGKGSNEGKDTSMFNFLGLNDLGSPRRNLA